MKVTKRQLQRIVQTELAQASRSRKPVKRNYVNIDVDSILREQKEDLGEGLFTQALKTAAINLVPGGRVAADFTRARGFEQLEDAAEQMESRLDSLEARVAALEGGVGFPPMP
jgi:hypothetical protein